MTLHNDPTAGAILRSTVERFERLSAEISDLRADQREVLAEAKAQGFDIKILRKLIARRKQDPMKRQEEEELLELYERGISGE